MNFCKLLKQERQRQEMSVKELAEKSGLTTRAIYYYEREQRDVTLSYAERILDALGLEMKIIKKED